MLRLDPHAVPRLEHGQAGVLGQQLNEQAPVRRVEVLERMKAMPDGVGQASSSLIQASRRPADPPRATTGKLTSAGTARPGAAPFSGLPLVGPASGMMRSLPAG